jgi:hypothetical protein
VACPRRNCQAPSLCSWGVLAHAQEEGAFDLSEVDQPEEEEPEGDPEREINVRPSFAIPQLRLTIPPEVLTNMRQNLLPGIEAFNRASQEWAESFRNAFIPFTVSVGTRLQESMREIAKAVSVLGEQWLASLPDNWRDEGSARMVHDIFDLMQETGWCLVWCPRAEIIRELLGLPDQDSRTAALLARKQDAIDDIRASLALVKDPALLRYRDFALKALDSFSDGHPEAAQALVATTQITMITEVFNLRKLKHARVTFDKDPMTANIRSFRNWCVQARLRQSLRPFSGDTDPVLEQFNRNGSAHCISPIQFTEVNSLTSLLLLNALLRETSLLFTEEEDAA